MLLRLLPGPAEEVTATEAYDDPARRRVASARGQPWVLVNMIAAADGAIAVDGRSGGLGGPADQAVFAALRSLADVVLVGAGTVRDEGYRPPSRPDLRIAVVSRRLAIDWDSALMTSGRAIVVTTERAGPVPAGVPCVRAGHDDVDLRAALDGLGALGAEVVLAEGGPTLNGHLLEAGLVDEWCLTAAPWLVGGPSGRASAGPVEVPVPLRLMHVAAAEQLVFLRYLATHGH